MMEVEAKYIVKLSERDAQNLKKILGSMNDDEFAQRGVRGEDRARMSDLWDLLPDTLEEG